MPNLTADRVKETTTTTGTGTLTLLGAATQFQSFAAAFADGSVVQYAIVGQGGTEWEVGNGTFTASGTTLARTTVLASSNAGAAVNFSAGTKDVFATVTAAHLLAAVLGPASATDNAAARFDATTGKLAQNSDLTIGDVSGSSVPVATTPGNAIAIAATAPAATTGASQAGKAASLTASAAVASTDTAGAAAGGSVTITAGAAARNTSGDADGGGINVLTGAGIGTGTKGRLGLESLLETTVGGTPTLKFFTGELHLASNGILSWGTQVNTFVSSVQDTAIKRYAAGVVAATDASNGRRGFIGGGAAIASATALPVPTGRVCHVTGTTTITSITSTNFQSGVVVTLIFDDVLTVTDGSNLKLAGNFVTAADSTLSLVYDGTNWFETSRSTN